MKSNRFLKLFGAALFAVMAIYYGWRMFALTPWYDELYTYYCFISKGPLYAAIHWPLPNNHVGYSVLSACLDHLGNPYIGLRGISWLCALANLYLLHRIAGRYLKSSMALVTVILYASMNLVNQQAVQGRGYTLGITCFLFAWYCMAQICETSENVPKRVYVCYIGALVLGLYTISSNVYWVVPLCLAGGCYLLLKGVSKNNGQPASRTVLMSKESLFHEKISHGKDLIRLIAASAIAALMTIFLYTTIWVAIGSNLLVKEEAGPYYGMGHVKMILSAPFAAIGRGMEYMLATPYIQSEERAGFAGRLGEYLKILSGSYYNSLGIAVIILWFAGILFLIFNLVKNPETASSKSPAVKNRLLYLVLLFEILFVPVCLLIQCKRPYYRVFTYGGVLLALLLGVLLEAAGDIFVRKLSDKKQRGIGIAGLLLAVVFGIKCLGFSGYNEQYGTREHEIADVLAHAEVEQRETFCVTDCNQEYLLYFLYGIRCENREIEGTDMLILDKRMMEPLDEMVWEFYHYYETIPWEYIEQNMTRAYENEDYVLFLKLQR